MAIRAASFKASAPARVASRSRVAVVAHASLAHRAGLAVASIALSAGAELGGRELRDGRAFHAIGSDQAPEDCHSSGRISPTMHRAGLAAGPALAGVSFAGVQDGATVSNAPTHGNRMASKMALAPALAPPALAPAQLSLLVPALWPGMEL